MRWFVDISPLGASEGRPQKWCIEAAGWQPALKEARSIRGETGPLGGFSIELLDDGARAVDPASRLKYVLRNAPDDAPLTHVKGEAVKAEPIQSPPAASPPAKSQPPGAGPSQSEPLPAFQLMHTREENPTERSPLTYREHVYAVPEGTSNAAIERLIFSRFEVLKDTLAGARPGRFVNLAVFDHIFTGKPSRRPRATLTWKDWRGGPEVRFPNGVSVAPPSMAAPTSTSQSVLTSSLVPPGSAGPSTEVIPSEAAVTVVASTQPAPLSYRLTEPPFRATEPAPAPVHKSEPPNAFRATEPSPEPYPRPETPPPAKEPEAPPPVKEPETPPPAKEPEPAAPPAEDPKPAPLPAEDPEPAPPPAVDPEPAPPPAQFQAPTAPTATVPPASALPGSAIPRTVPAGSAPAQTAPREAFIPPAKTRTQAGTRMSGDDLIVELFEACGDLQFVRDSLEGADFVLTLALEKLPSEVGLVSLFDINRREFVVVRQAGGARSIVLSRMPERAGLAQPAMRKGAAIVVPDAATEPRALDDRFRTLGIALKSLMVAPVEQSGRYLGLIELLNPVDGRAFSESDGHALTYIGEQYAEFVANQGIVLDPDTVLARHQKR